MTQNVKPRVNRIQRKHENTFGYVSNVHAYHGMKFIAMPWVDADFKKSCDKIELSDGLQAEYIRDVQP